VPALDPADIEALLAKDPSTGLTEFERRQCRHCGGVHSRACPRVKRLRYTDSGAIAEIEYWPDAMWSDTGVIWPEMLGVLYEPKGAQQ
jgi:hypothetical protein